MSEIQHSSRAHARLNASSFYSWMMCPPSVKLSEQFADKPSAYAEEGTFLHELCELKLHRYLGDMAPELIEHRLDYSEYVPDGFDTGDLAMEMTWRRSLSGHYSGKSSFSSRVVCGECGAFYGSKVWHSTDEYQRVVWRCNGKYEGDKMCSTPHVTQDEPEKAFIAAM